MSREIEIDVGFEESILDVDVDFGQVVIVTEGPETYIGPVTVTPTESEQTLLTKDKLLTDNVTVNPIPSEYTDAKADYDNALTAFGVESDLADGITALTTYSNSVTSEADENLSDAVRSLADMAVEEWDGILYPADEEGRFNCKWLYLEAGDKVIVEWYGRGNRVWAFRGSGNYKTDNRGNNPSVFSYNAKDYHQNYCMVHCRQELNPVEGLTVFVAAGYEWSPDGGHSGNDSYNFFGEYFKYKVIRAS